jgi:hypothetical protein
VAQWLVVVTDVSRSFLDRLLKPQCARADCDAIAILQLMLKTRVTIYEDLVCAAPELAIDNRAVNNREILIVCLRDMSVITRGTRIIQDHRIVGRTTDSARGLWQKTKLPLSPAGVGDL